VKRIGIIVVAYNAASTLAKVLDRIPREFVPRIDQILICDNASEDQTYLVGLGYKQVDGRSLPLNVVRNARNLGYGGNQKVGYEWAIEHGLDIVVLLHADGQYAPEFLPQIVAPLEAGEADAVFGSRMMTKGGARGGGMPFYKFVGNKVLTTFENRVVGTNLSEWHSGYRAYSVETLREIPFRRNTDEYDFDTEIIVQLHEAGKRIVELPIPTYYGEEISYVNGMRYAKDIVLDVLRYRAHKIGLGSGQTAFATSPYEPKGGADTASGRMLAWIGSGAAERVLVVAGDDGSIAAALTAGGHDVVGIRPQPMEEHAEGGPDVGPDVEAIALPVVDLEDGIPEDAGTGFDTILLVDALGRVRQPERLLEDAMAHLAPGGRILASVPNFGHWYPRARVATGRWGYDQRGILDRSTARFFVPRESERLFADAGLTVERREHVGLPLGSGADRREALAVVDGIGLVVAPSLFAYEHLYDLRPRAEV
jgi:glycosyltransferase involved in cell wall biosynthesis/2-polyprenyl-3-methyl-5-hydroxy-6-metoxy-1,4-benzoquinol methylase